MLNAAGVRPTSLPIGKLLTNRSPARVPRYQRSYAWEDEQVSDLIEDIKLLLTVATGERGHFYGGMVAIEIGDATEAGGTVYEVVDGQQRLATFCLLLAQIAVRADELGAIAESQAMPEIRNKFTIFAKSIRKEFLYYERYDVTEGSESEQPRLRLSRADDEVFQGLLRGEAASTLRASHKLLEHAAHLLRKELILERAPDADLYASFDSLVRIRDAVIRDSFVIHIVSEERANGYRLFAVLNDRGARLTVADLLRSHTLEMLDSVPDLCRKAAELWDDLLADGGDDVDDFLKAYYTSLVGRRPSRDDLFDDTKKLLFSPGVASEMVVQGLKDMGRELGSFKSISKGVWPYVGEQQMSAVTEWDRARLGRLVSVLRHELSTPMLLAARAVCDEAEFAELVHLVEIFAFRYKNVCGAHAGPASGSYYAECKRLRALSSDAKVNFTKLRESLRGLLALRAPDLVFETSIANQLHYDAGNAAKANIRHLLTMLEDYRSWVKLGANGVPRPARITVTDLKLVTIEHLYPQSSSPRDPALESHVNRLGNLSYWEPSDNREAGNLPFVDKLPAYRASKVGLNNDLSEWGAWDLTALEEREERLIKQACQVFTI
ncbi:hypothetical protein CF165_23535 [Amycolatopsis vastitatis]|uniref:DUF262 domain-containing protein n=2 Tax=Amycolatopsis vastitatis TaxID=1905142 RepID=A0A229T204_9PSEU|nr:hypothetical protein CF165_23535 [Amycolatopsis vastitatis]